MKEEILKKATTLKIQIQGFKEKIETIERALKEFKSSDAHYFGHVLHGNNKEFVFGFSKESKYANELILQAMIDILNKELKLKEEEFKNL